MTLPESTYWKGGEKSNFPVVQSDKCYLSQGHGQGYDHDQSRYMNHAASTSLSHDVMRRALYVFDLPKSHSLNLSMRKISEHFQ